MRISDWSSDVCSSDLAQRRLPVEVARQRAAQVGDQVAEHRVGALRVAAGERLRAGQGVVEEVRFDLRVEQAQLRLAQLPGAGGVAHHFLQIGEHTSELQSLMRISYAVFCLKKTTH